MTEHKPKSVIFYANFFAELNQIRVENLRDYIRITPPHMQTIVQLLADYQQLELQVKKIPRR